MLDTLPKDRAGPVTAAEAPKVGAAPSVMPPARPTRARPRHRIVAVAFLVMVILPLGLSAWYLWTRAADQYVSELGFTVRREEAGVSPDLLGGLTQLSSGASSDTDVLFQYIQSQDLVSRIDEALDLRARYAVNHTLDPVFSLEPGASIEQLVAFWRRMLQISYNPGSGMMDLRVHGFAPREAQMIAEEILSQSARVINDISAIARADATRYAAADLTLAEDRLRDARAALTAFRSDTQIIDPRADLEGQMGLLNSLQAQLARAVIDLALLQETTRSGDPRLAQAERRITVIEAQIEVERRKLGQGGLGLGAAGQGGDYAAKVAEFERLSVDRTFAEEAYLTASAAFSSARAEAERQSRYLAAYVQPTLAETPTHPRRWLLLGLTALFLTLTWAICVLIYYSLRDRR